MVVKVCQCINPEFLEIVPPNEKIEISFFEETLKATLLEIEHIKDVSLSRDSKIVIKLFSKHQTSKVINELKGVLEKSFDYPVEISYKEVSPVDYF